MCSLELSDRQPSSLVHVCHKPTSNTTMLTSSASSRSVTLQCTVENAVMKSTLETSSRAHDAQMLIVAVKRVSSVSSRFKNAGILCKNRPSS